MRRAQKRIPACVSASIGVASLVTASLVVGCSSAAPEHSAHAIAIQQIANLTQCPLTVDAGVTRLTTYREVEQRSTAALGMPSVIERALDATDFDAMDWLVVFDGAKPNPGYQWALSDSKAALNGSTLGLPVTLSEPSPDGIYPQVMTSPCLVLVVPAESNFDDADWNR